MTKENKTKLFVPLHLRSKGFTLIEMVVVVAIIAILVSMVVGVAKRISDQSKENLCRTTIVIIGNALEQYRDFGFEYRNADYSGLVFPLDCNGYKATDTYPYPDLQNTLEKAIYSSPVTIYPNDNTYDPNFSGSAALYIILSQIPDCRKTLGKIDKSLLTNKDNSGKDMTYSVNGVSYPFIRFVDPWKTTLRYDYYPDYADYKAANPTKIWADYIEYINSAKRTFPVITSAGPDGKFDTADDISNMKPK